MGEDITVSIVIPVHNEADTIADCLDCLVKQSRSFDECVIVDNNCTDDTVAIAQTFADRLPLRIVRESRQGLTWARDTGIDASSGQVIGRIDADTRIDQDWCRALVDLLVARPDVDAVCGFDYLYDVPFERSIEKRARAAAAKAGPGRAAPTLIGNNHALRRSAWTAARGNIRNLPGTHEDIDLYYALLEAGATVWLLPGLIAGVSPRRFRRSPWANRGYRRGAVTTTRVHGRKAEARALALQAPLIYAGLTAWWVLVKPFDPQNRTWRLWRLFGPDDGRRSPMTGEGH